MSWAQFSSAPELHRREQGTHRGTIAGVGGGVAEDQLPPFNFRLSYAVWVMMDEAIQDFEFRWIWDEPSFAGFPLGTVTVGGQNSPLTPARLQREAPEIYARLRAWMPGLPLEIKVEVTFYSDEDERATPRRGFAHGEMLVRPDLVAGSGQPNRLHSPSSPSWAALFQNVIFAPVDQGDRALADALRAECAGKDEAFVNRTAYKHARRIILSRPRIVRLPGDGPTAAALLRDFERGANGNLSKDGKSPETAAKPAATKAGGQKNPFVAREPGPAAEGLAAVRGPVANSTAENPFVREARLAREQDERAEQLGRERKAREEQLAREERVRQEELRRRGLRKFYVVRRDWYVVKPPFRLLFSGGTEEERSELLSRERREAEAETERLQPYRRVVGPVDFEVFAGPEVAPFEIKDDGQIEALERVVGDVNRAKLKAWEEAVGQALSGELPERPAGGFSREHRRETRWFATRESAEAYAAGLGWKRSGAGVPAPQLEPMTAAATR